MPGRKYGLELKRHELGWDSMVRAVLLQGMAELFNKSVVMTMTAKYTIMPVVRVFMHVNMAHKMERIQKLMLERNNHVDAQQDKKQYV